MEAAKMNFIKNMKDNLSFLKAFFTHPVFVGTFLPTTKHAAEELAALVNTDQDGYVIELGPGTGVITQALIDHGIDPQKIIGIEYSDEFIKTLKEKFPKSTIIHGDAAKVLSSIAQNKKIIAVVSSIPVVVLPKEKVESILVQIKNILAPKGRYIQLTYNFNENQFNSLSLFKHIAIKRVIKNVPPIRLDVYEV